MRWQDVTAAQFLGEVRAVAKGLVAAGIEAGDRVGLISRTRYEWTLLDYAIWFAGAATVPIYETSSAEQVEWILSDSGARAVVAETPEHLARIRECRDRLDELHHVWSIEGGAVNVLTRLGADIADDELEARRTKAGPDSLATLIYTSGTTGRPKGCMLTHGNFLFELAVATEELDALFAPSPKTGGVPRRCSSCRWPTSSPGSSRSGASRRACGWATPPTSRTCSTTSPSFEPTFILAVPRVFEKVFNSASQRAIADGRGRIFSRAADVAIAWSRGLETGRIPLPVRAQHRLFDRLVYARLRKRSAAGVTTQSPVARRSATGSGTSTAGSGSTSSRATGSPRPLPP